MKMLRDSGVVINKTHQGIYRFDGKLSIPVQLVISSQLPTGEYDGLRLLAKGATVNDMKNYVEKAIASGNERIKENAGTVLDICLAVNKNLEGVDSMYEGFREVFKDFIAKERQEERHEATEKANERVAVDMLNDGEPLAKIIRYSKLAESAIRNLAKSNGIVI